MLVLREIGNNNKAMLPWLFLQKEKYNKLCCPLEAIRPSPVQVNHLCIHYSNHSHTLMNSQNKYHEVCEALNQHFGN